MLPESPWVQRARTFTLLRGEHRVYVKVNLIRCQRAGGSTELGGMFVRRRRVADGSWIII
jgi:hypothetical protein